LSVLSWFAFGTTTAAAAATASVALPTVDRRPVSWAYLAATADWAVASDSCSGAAFFSSMASSSFFAVTCALRSATLCYIDTMSSSMTFMAAPFSAT
jgi:hypothetical protein